jgi:putative sugar O-methyltransferase
VERLVNTRPEYIARHQLDPAVALPGNNWDPDADQPFQNRYRSILKGDYSVLNNLRLYAQFSSYDLATQRLITSGRDVPSITADFDEQMERLAPAPDDWVRRYLAAIRNVPERVVPTYPKVLGEIGWDYEGRPINHDAYAYQERLNLMFEAGIIDWLRDRIQERGSVNILEIGGGYGGLAHALISILPGGLNYFICDLPESLLSSTIYLGITHPDRDHLLYEGTDPKELSNLEGAGRCVYVPNYMFDDFLAANCSVSLAINTLSFPEMTEAQVRYYGERLRKLIGTEGVLFEQNNDGRWVGLLDCKAILSEYFPFRRTLRPKSIPVISKGTPDVWSNRPVTEIIGERHIPFRSGVDRARLWLWRMAQLVRIPGWGLVRLRQALQETVSPQTFRFIKACWNRLGGRMSS